MNSNVFVFSDIFKRNAKINFSPNAVYFGFGDGERHVASLTIQIMIKNGQF